MTLLVRFRNGNLWAGVRIVRDDLHGLVLLRADGLCPVAIPDGALESVEEAPRPL